MQSGKADMKEVSPQIWKSDTHRKLVSINSEHLNGDFRKFFKLQMRCDSPPLTEVAYALPEQY
jgi:hypothetical protein